MPIPIPKQFRALTWFPTLALVVCIQAGAVGALAQEIVEGVLHVRNGETPTEGVEVLEMQELWIAGGEEDTDILFGLITRAGADNEGNVHVLDSQLNQVMVFSPEGELLRTLFREGEGPGEISSPRDMMIMEDGRVGVVQEFPGAAIFVDRDGNPAGRLDIGGADGGLYNLTGCDATGTHYVFSGSEQLPGDTPGISNRTYYLSSFDSNGIEKTRFCESRAVYNFNDFLFDERVHTPTFWWAFAVGKDGRIYVAPDRDNYAIQVFDHTGGLEMVIHRDYQPMDRDDQEFERTRQMYESALTNLPVDYRLAIERRAAAVAYLQRGLRVRPDGSLWVMSCSGIRDLPPGVLVVFDVFDPNGAFIKQVELRGPGDPLSDGIFFTGEDRIVVVKGYMESLAAQFGSGTTVTEEEEESESYLAVICYELVLMD